MRSVYLWVGLGALLPAGYAAADDADLVELLQAPIVTTASQGAETASSAPATTTTIDAEQLRKFGIHTIAEAVNFLALGVSTTGGATAVSDVELGARGVALANTGGSHFLLLIDGHAVNEPLTGSMAIARNAGMPLEFVDHIEVMVGPGSVLYGSNAMLGVINVVTKRASSINGVRLGLESELPVGHRAVFVAGTSFDLVGQRVELTGAAEYYYEFGPDWRLGPQNLGTDVLSGRPSRTRRDGPETGIWGGVARDSTFARIPSGTLRLRSGQFELAVSARLDEHGLPFVAGDFDSPESNSLERFAALDLKYGKFLTPKLRVSARAYADSWDWRARASTSQVFSCPYVNVTTCRYEQVAASRWVGTEFQSGYDWFGKATFSTLIGVDGRIRLVRAKLDVSDWDTGRYLVDSSNVIRERDQTLGAYLQQVWSPVESFGLNAGVRVDRDSRFPLVASPRAAASFSPWSGGVLRGIYSQAFRAPTFAEGLAKDVQTARAENLEPETVRSVEASFEQRFGSHRVFFGAYRTWWSNLIEVRFLTFEQAERAVQLGLLDFATPSVAYAQYQNSASVDNFGFNASIDGSMLTERLRYGVNVADAHARRSNPDGADQLVPAAPRFSANARLAYELGSRLPTVALAAYALAPRLADRASEGFQPTPFAPTQVGIRLTTSGRLLLPKGLYYRLSGDWMFGNRGPYVIGPVVKPTAENPSAELIPIPPFRVTLGLEYAPFDD